MLHILAMQECKQCLTNEEACRDMLRGSVSEQAKNKEAAGLTWTTLWRGGVTGEPWSKTSKNMQMQYFCYTRHELLVYK